MLGIGATGEKPLGIGSPREARFSQVILATTTAVSTIIKSSAISLTIVTTPIPSLIKAFSHVITVSSISLASLVKRFFQGPRDYVISPMRDTAVAAVGQISDTVLSILAPFL